MAITQISGNQISTSTQAIITTLSFLNANSVLRIPAGTTANRPTGVSVGTIRFNTDNDAAEIYKADDGTGSAGWASISVGGPAVGTDSVIRTNAAAIAGGCGNQTTTNEYNGSTWSAANALNKGRVCVV